VAGGGRAKRLKKLKGEVFMPEKELEFQIHKTDNKEKWTKLFLLFLQGIPELYFQAPQKIIPYVIARLSLINRRVTLCDSKKILEQFCERGFLLHVPRRGYKINWSEIRALLDNISVAEIASNAGLDFVNSSSFQFCVWKKAQEDVKFWLEHAPHGLRRRCENG
jgi:hypothetical protein